MRKTGLVLVCGLLWGAAMLSPALPQPEATETVTVTGQKIGPVPRAVIDTMITTRMAPTKMADKIARWKNPICPETIGMKPEVAAVVNIRIREVAAAARAPVETRAPCTPNVTIVFTKTPQDYLDDIAARHPNMIGYHESMSQVRSMAVMRHPIQAWYATQTTDYLGHTFPDDKDFCDKQAPAAMTFGSPQGHGMVFDMPQTCTYATSGLTQDDGVSSDFSSVLVVVDTNRMDSQPFGAIVDYVAMVVLSQTKRFDNCDELPTIANLMSENCDARWKTSALTEGDIAYLRALYKMQPGGNLRVQRADIAREMARELDQ